MNERNTEQKKKHNDIFKCTERERASEHKWKSKTNKQNGDIWNGRNQARLETCSLISRTMISIELNESFVGMHTSKSLGSEKIARIRLRTVQTEFGHHLKSTRFSR